MIVFESEEPCGGAVSMRPVSRWLALAATAVLLVTGCGGSGGEPRAGSGSGTTSAGPSSTAAPPALVAGAKGWLAYQSISSRGPDGVYLVRVDGSADHEIVTDVPGQRLHPDFSRDGPAVGLRSASLRR